MVLYERKFVPHTVFDFIPKLVGAECGGVKHDDVCANECGGKEKVSVANTSSNQQVHKTHVEFIHRMTHSDGYDVLVEIPHGKFWKSDVNVMNSIVQFRGSNDDMHYLLDTIKQLIGFVEAHADRFVHWGLMYEPGGVSSLSLWGDLSGFRFSCTFDGDYVERVYVETRRDYGSSKLHPTVVVELVDGTCLDCVSMDSILENEKRQRDEEEERKREEEEQKRKNEVEDLVGRFREKFGDVETSEQARELATWIDTANEWYGPLIGKIMESVKNGKCSCVVDERDFPGRGWEYAQSWLRKNGYKFHNITYEGYWKMKTYGWFTDYQHEAPCWEPGYTSYEVKIEW